MADQPGVNGLPTITLYPEHAELFRLGRRSIETRSRATRHRGRIGLHAGWRDPDSAAASRDPVSRAALAAIPHGEPLTRGALVATAVLVDCVPTNRLRFARQGEAPNGWMQHEWGRDGLTTFIHPDQLPLGDFAPGRCAWLLEDIKPTIEACPWCLGPGNNVIEESWCPASQRDGKHCNCSTVQDICHWCLIEWLGDGEWSCPVCDGVGRCEPIPAKGRLGLWPWRPAS